MSTNGMMVLTLEQNGLDSLMKAASFLQKVKTDPFALKWFILAAHSSLHNFMLAALAGSAQQGVWEFKTDKEGKPKEFVEYRADGLIDIFNPKNRLMPFLQAYDQIKDPAKMRKYVHSYAFKAEGKHNEAMRFLNEELRNTLVHLMPLTYGMRHDYIAECVPILDVLEFLLFESGQIIHLSPDANAYKARKKIAYIRKKLSEI